jgi:hypothetical protein
LGCVFLVLCLAQMARAHALPQAYSRAHSAYQQARTARLAAPEDPKLAAVLAQRCFEFSELNTNRQNRASLAEEGISSARFAIQKAPKDAAGHLYLGLNLGELARTKMLSALSLLRQMEKALLHAAALESQLGHAAADRSLGLLYLEAPGWPASVGSKRKAREHLVRAVTIAPDYPDNHLSLLEAYIRWNEEMPLVRRIEQYKQILPEARKKYSGPEWEQAWHDWDERWNAVYSAFAQQKCD